jgi:hypothetical protein
MTTNEKRILGIGLLSVVALIILGLIAKAHLIKIPTTAHNDPPIKGTSGSIDIQLYDPESAVPGSAKWPVKVNPVNAANAGYLCLYGFTGVQGCSPISPFNDWTVYINDGNAIQGEPASITHGVTICGNSKCQKVEAPDSQMSVELTVDSDALIPSGGTPVPGYAHYVSYEFQDKSINCDSTCSIKSVYVIAPGQKPATSLYTCPPNIVCQISLGEMGWVPTMRWSFR